MLLLLTGRGWIMLFVLLLNSEALLADFDSRSLMAFTSALRRLMLSFMVLSFLSN